MSWLFGLRKDPSVPIVPPPPGGDDTNSNGQQQPSPSSNITPGSRSSEAYRFDSSALERAAQAAKDLEKSSENYAQNVCI